MASALHQPALPLQLLVVSLLALSNVQAALGIQPDGACALLNLLPFSDQHIYSYRGLDRRDTVSPAYGNLTRWSAASIGLTGYTYSAAALMAMDHFNSRDASVVPEIADISPNCTVYFPTDDKSYRLRDSAVNNRIASEAILEATQHGPATAGTGIAPGNDTVVPVCAILGPYDMKSADWVAPITSSLDLPQVFYSTVRQQVVESDTFDNTVGAAVALHTEVRAFFTYLNRLGRSHLAIIHGGSEYDTGLAELYEKLSETTNVTVQLFALLPPREGKGSTKGSPLTAVFQDVRKSGIRTLMQLIQVEGPKHLSRTASYAAKQGLLDDDYMWVFDHRHAPTGNLPEIVGQVEEGSDLDRLLSGALVLSPLDGFTRDRENDRFFASWQQAGMDFVRRVNALSPLTSDDPEYFQGEDDFFQMHEPSVGASFVYDAVMAVGFGGCHAQTPPTPNNGNSRESKGQGRVLQSGQKPPKKGGPPPAGGGPPEGEALEIGNQHVVGILASSFTGASGSVAFAKRDERDKTRDESGMSLGAFNIRPHSTDNANGTRDYKVVHVSTVVGDRWEDFEGASFLYRDGTSNSPGPGIVILEMNYLGWARAVGFVLLFISWAVSLVLSFAVWWWREKQHIKGGQPIFLQVLLCGSFVTSGSILTLSFDESIGLGQSGLSFACQLTPWLFFVGMTTMYAGLFCKLWRVDKLTQFRRRAVTATQVLWPLVALLVSTVSMLVVWTVVDPWAWERYNEGTSPPVSFGQCESNHFAWFFAPLCGVMVVATVLAVVMAWKTKDVNADRTVMDSSSVFYAVSSQLQAWFVGLPILIVLEDSSVVATYLGRILLVWIFAFSTVVIVVVPRIYRTWNDIQHPPTQSRSVYVSGLTPPGSRMTGPRESVATNRTANRSSAKTDSEEGKIQSYNCVSSGLDAAPGVKDEDELKNGSHPLAVSEQPLDSNRPRVHSESSHQEHSIASAEDTPTNPESSITEEP